MFAILVLVCLLGSALSEKLPNLGIVGGHAAKDILPYQISLEFLKDHHCGGAIVSPTLIITAAHCTHDFLSRFLTVRAGTIVREEGGQVVKVAEFINHPKFHPKTLDYDVSVVKLATPLKLNKDVQAVDLPEQDEKFKRFAIGTISGWGDTEEGSKRLSKVLKVAKVPILDRETCSTHIAGFTDRMFCAGNLEEGGTDACRCDSGGPLVIDGKLFGIISWGVGCARPNNPGVYTNVPALRTWIDATIRSLSY